jgi:hypothetical protein
MPALAMGRRATRLAGGLPLAAGALAVTVWTALFTVAATGHLTRWLAFRARLAPAAAPGTLAPAPVAAAAAASLIRLTLARRAGRRCLAARAALT